MKLSEYAKYDATGLAELVRKKEVTPLELFECAKEALEKVNPILNIVSYKAYEYALEQIDRGIDLKAPFAGVPFFLKDIDAMAKGIPASGGSRLMEGKTIDYDTAFVQRLKKAGFVIMATTNTPEYCYSMTTESVRHGSTRNPWNTEYSTGGSSGGSAAAVASGVVPMAHGTDAGGSIRQPASCCGLVGLKPSRFRTPYGPAESMQYGGVSTEFALTRTIRDTAGLLDVVSGTDSGYFATMPAPEMPYVQRIKKKTGPLKIAYTTTYPLGGKINDDCYKALMNTVDILKDAGHELIEAFPKIDPNIHKARRIIQSTHVAMMMDNASQKLHRQINTDYVEQQILEIYHLGKTSSAIDYAWAQGVNNNISRVMGAFMEDYDLIICPTMGVLPSKIGELDNAAHPEWSPEEWAERKSYYTHFTNPFNATGQPSMNVPLFQSEIGLPIGIELSAAIGREDIILEVAAELEKLLPWSGRRPHIYIG